MKTTHTYHKETYLSSTYLNPSYLARLQGFRPHSDGQVDVRTRSAYPKELGGFMSSIWLWLRLCIYVFTGRGEAFDSEAEFVPFSAYRPNRANRHIQRHFAQHKRLPIVRRYGILYAFGSRHITPTQFLERRCRLSGVARFSIYRMIYYAHRKVREALWARFSRGDFRPPQGLCAAHLWPS